MLPLAVAHIGHQQTRNRGTIGGSICHLDPGAELPVVASALEASLIAVSLKGTRTISMDDFAVNYLTNQLDAGELLLALEIPKYRPRSGVAFEEFSRRPADLAVVSVASVIELAPDGAIDRAAVAIGGLGAGPTRLRDFEASCVGTRLDGDVVRAASAAAREQPAVGQGEYSSDYRSHLAGVLCARSIRDAGKRAGLRG
jgi:carbon-monoxide dehydrogenase medium subunit